MALNKDHCFKGFAALELTKNRFKRWSQTFGLDRIEYAPPGHQSRSRAAARRGHHGAGADEGVLADGDAADEVALAPIVAPRFTSVGRNSSGGLLERRRGGSCRW